MTTTSWGAFLDELRDDIDHAAGRARIVQAIAPPAAHDRMQRALEAIDGVRVHRVTGDDDAVLRRLNAERDLLLADLRALVFLLPDEAAAVYLRRGAIDLVSAIDISVEIGSEVRPGHYDFFLAHASKDKPRVRELADALEATGRRVFLDERALRPGDEWDRRIPDAQRASRIVVVLVSEHFDRAHMLRDEVQAAIVMARSGLQRVVPVYLDGIPERQPYGLGIYQGLDLADRGLAGVVEALAELAGPVDAEVDGTVAAVVGVADELDAELAAAEAVLRADDRFAAVRRVDPREPAALDRARRADLRVVLIGASTGGVDGEAVLATLLADTDRVVAAALDPVPRKSRQAYKAEYDAAMALGDRCERTFSGAADVATALRDAVAAWTPPAESEEATGLHLWERRYLMTRLPFWVAGSTGPLTAVAHGTTLTREPLYVSLHADPAAWVRDGDGVRACGVDEGRLERRGPRGERDEPAPAFLDEVLSLPEARVAAVIGEAGTGKSVLLQHVATTLASVLLGRDPPAQARLDVAALSATTHPRVPVLVEAREVDIHLRRDLGRGIVDALAAELGAPRREVDDALADGRLLVLVDSLDEVPSIRGRHRVLQALSGFADLYPRARLVLTTRPIEHTGVAVPDAFVRVPIAPLDADRQRALVDRWCTAQTFDLARGGLDGALAQLAERFPTGPAGRSPLENPLLLTCVLLVWVNERRLPDNTADLYDQMVRILLALRPEGEQGRSGAMRRELLERVAHDLQVHGSTARALRAVAEGLRADPTLGFDDRRAAEVAVDDLAARTGILRIERGERGPVVRPWHRSFQEYLAARHLATREQPVDQTVAALLTDRPGHQAPLVDPKWEGCARFLTGAFGQGGLPKARAWLTALRDRATAERAPEREGRLWGLVAWGLAEYGAEYFAGHPLEDEVPPAVVAAVEARGADWPLADRVLALRALGRLGDPRLDVDPWVWVPPMVVSVGGDREALQSLPASRCELDGLWVRRWPVTVAEYRKFVDDPSFGDPRWWDGRPEEPPTGWAWQRGQPTDPVVSVSWWGARAFCRWAQARWDLPGDGVIDLPTSSEWEAVATGDRGGPYPWGRAEPDPARANFGGEVGETSPVGACPRGHAGGVWDLAGNVWEWTASLREDRSERDIPLDGDARSGDGRHDDNKRRDVDSEAPRVLRGGAWSYPAWNLRCAGRSRYLPRYRSRSIGFRVVCRPSPSSDVVP